MLTVITGAPCSGKTTYLNEHAQPGDVRIDFDTIAQALGSPVRHEHPEHVRMVTIATRRAAITAAIEQHHKGATVWIVDTNPGARMLAYRKAGARIVTMTADTDELYRRAAASRPPRWRQLIDEYFVNTALGPDAQRPARRR